MIDMAVIIVSWNVQDLLIPCIQSVLDEFAHSHLSGHIWVIDNNSADESVPLMQQTFGDRITLLCNQDNPGFGAANNQGIRLAQEQSPQTVLLLNPDTFVYPNALRQMYDHLTQTPQTGMVGCHLEFGDGSFQHSAFRFPGIWQLLFELYPMPARFYESALNGRYPKDLYQGDVPFTVDHPLGAVMLIRNDALAKTTGFDEQFYLYCEEVDWAMRVRKAGWVIETVPQAKIIHYGGQSSGQVRAWSLIQLWRSRATFYKLHYPRWKYQLAKWVAQTGLKRKGKKAESAEVQQAYQQAIAEWK